MSKISHLLHNGGSAALKGRVQQAQQSLWQGPDSDGANGGVTFSLLSKFLCDRERFRILTLEGLKAKPKFSHLLEFGNMWHVCEEIWAAGAKWIDDAADPQGAMAEVVSPPKWEAELHHYCRQLMDRFPFQREEVTHWWQMCLCQFPKYVEYWQRNNDQQKREPLLQEQVFDVPYQLPSGRTVRLRGKWDSVDLVDGGVWIQENKTKSSIDKRQLERQLSFDLQSMIYLIAMDQWVNSRPEPDEKVVELVSSKIKGIRYNVVRRSAHKTPQSMLKKLEEDVGNGRGGEWFDRWNVEVSQQDVAKFKRTCLDPILEQLWCWWDLVSTNCCANAETLVQSQHYRMPYGIWNPLMEGYETEYDGYLRDGNSAGLERATDLFPELKEGG